jgi:hypothetical protein
MTFKDFVNKIVLGKTKTELYNDVSKKIVFNKDLSSKLYDKLDGCKKEFTIDNFKIKVL